MSILLANISKSEFAEKYIEILKPIETFISNSYRKYPELHDHNILGVYEMLLKHIKAKLTNFPLPQHKFEGILNEIYASQLSFLEEMESVYSLKEMQECLKTLEKSLKFWNREHGSRGYLNFIVQFC